MKLTALEIANITQGKLIGNNDHMITGVAPLIDASQTDLSYISEKKYFKLLVNSKAGVILAKNGETISNRNAIFVDDPQFAFLKILELISQEKEKKQSYIHPSATLSPKAIIGKNVTIQAQCVIEDDVIIEDETFIGALSFIGEKTKIGKNCKIYPHVTIRENSHIGNRVIIHSGTVIGSDGFGYAFKDLVHHKIPQIGMVQIDDDVEIGSNVSIDRATMGKTWIGQGTKIDNLVQIAHNVQIGPGCIIVAQVGIAGSARLGKFVTLAGQSAVNGHIEIGDRVIAAAQSGIPNNLEAGAIVFGTPARPIQIEKRIQVIISKLPKIYDDFKKIKKLLKLEN